MLTVCVGFSVVPEPPLTPNPAPLADTPEIVTSTLPMFVTDRICEVEFPTVTFPKFTCIVLIEICAEELFGGRAEGWFGGGPALTLELVNPVHAALASIAARAMHSAPVL